MTPERTGMKIFSWNINGIRTLDFVSELKKLDGDIVCVQETKISRDQLPETTALVDEYSSYFTFSRNRIGYAGVATYCKSRIAPENAEEGLCSPPQKDGDEISQDLVLENEKSLAKYADADGRAIITFHRVKTDEGDEKTLVVINLYCPRLRDDPEDTINNTDFKKFFHSMVQRRAQIFTKLGYFVLILGDLNVSHNLIDQSRAADTNQFIETEFRTWLTSLLSEKEYEIHFVDTYRKLFPDKEKAFTCWCTKTNARQNNFGSRIDYILADKNLSKYLVSADIHADILGSDHCPISATFESLTPLPSKKLPSLATKFYAEFSGKQLTMKSFLVTPSSKSEKRISENENEITTISSQKKRQVSLNTFFTKKPKLELDVKPSEKKDEPSHDTTNTHETSFYKDVNSSAANAWKQMFKGPQPVSCKGHKENCVLRTVRKKGPNQGRQFWACPRGEGVSSDPNSNCGFFQWVKPTK